MDLPLRNVAATDATTCPLVDASSRADHGEIDSDVEPGRTATTRYCVVVVVVAIGFALFALSLPVHIVPANGSLRCGDSYFSVSYDDSEGLGDMCRSEAQERLRDAVGVGAAIAVGGVAMRRRSRAARVIGVLAGIVAFVLGTFDVLGNLVG